VEGEDLPGAAAGYIEVLVTDEFRDIAPHCRDELRGGHPAVLAEYDFHGEAGTVQRALRILVMAASSPNIPDAVRGHAAAAAQWCEWWPDELMALLVPFLTLRMGGGEVAYRPLTLVD
jgi:hypothetical protein